MSRRGLNLGDFAVQVCFWPAATPGQRQYYVRLARAGHEQAAAAFDTHRGGHLHERLLDMRGVYDFILRDLEESPSQRCAVVAVTERAGTPAAMALLHDARDSLSVGLLAGNSASILHAPNSPHYAGEAAVCAGVYLSVLAGFRGALTLRALMAAEPWYEGQGFRRLNTHGDMRLAASVPAQPTAEPPPQRN
jgi:hypothetical protein